MEESKSSTVYPCAVESSDSLRVDNEFDSNDRTAVPDMEFSISQGKTRQRYSVWLNIDEVKALNNKLADALHNYYEAF